MTQSVTVGQCVGVADSTSVLVTVGVAKVPVGVGVLLVSVAVGVVFVKVAVGDGIKGVPVTVGVDEDVFVGLVGTTVAVGWPETR